MINEAFKKQLLSSHDVFSKTRWEGKPLGFRLRFFYANHAEICIGMGLIFIVAPAIFAYKTMTYDTSMEKALLKYKYHYKVVRDDDPNIQEVLKEKEMGREYFPKY